MDHMDPEVTIVDNTGLVSKLTAVGASTTNIAFARILVMLGIEEVDRHPLRLI